MSTTFAIKIKGELETIAFRHNGGRIEVLNKLIHTLNKNRRVYATDNTQQGVYTIGDILK